MQNPNPIIFETQKIQRIPKESDFDDNIEDEIDEIEIFEMLRNIVDPEHPLSLEELNVITLDGIKVFNKDNYVLVNFTPTIPGCTMSTLIGLSIRTKLERSLPSRFKFDVLITKGTHNSENDINKQVNDKERCRAALEQPHLLQIVNDCIRPSLQNQTKKKRK
ncbi:cytosolic iron-sulfur assembly component 2b [Anaeramoeba ignava]|uniref:Cytosolic iron-sulfur assembly component 2b n=1 Tax=Anaeramoeba ignava TaxID=1746090 RepID=A0A9Q0REQ1_ANAIG|nr:cytosolic iron-sulfur assembly component 2b [Anaeramoeba ignava]